MSSHNTFKYDRDRVIAYAKTWSLLDNPLYPNLNLGIKNNTNFAFQCLFNGGQFLGGSRYIDRAETGKFPIISKYLHLDKALREEVQALTVTSSVFPYPEAQSGDIVAVKKNNIYVWQVIEKRGDSRVVYSKDPTIRGGSVFSGEEYTLYLIPDFGRRVL
jgi:hypothetical protein